MAATTPTVTIAYNLRVVNNIPATSPYFGSWETYLAMFGALNPAIYGQAPQTLAATLNVPYYPTPSAADLRTGPGIFLTAGTTLLGQAVSPSVGGGVLTGVDYTDADGNHWTTVNWQWLTIADEYNYALPGVEVWGQQVVTWTGNGIAGHVIPTTVDLSTGHWAIWIFPTSGGEPTVCTSNMFASGIHAIMSIQSPGSTIGGVMTVSATGFTIKDDAVNGVKVNINAVTYTAVVLCSSTGASMECGHYANIPDVISPPFVFVSQFITCSTPGSVSMVWVVGRSDQLVFKTTAMPTTGSLSTALEAQSLTNQISLFEIPANPTVNPSIFRVSRNSNVDDSSGSLPRYYYVAFKIAASDPIFQTFSTWKVTGAGGVGATVSGLGYTPGFALARPYVAGVPESVWRGPLQVGTVSTYCTISSGDSAAGGIKAFGVGTITLGAVTAANGTDVYGFSLAGTGSTSVTYAAPLWVHTETTTVADGTTALVETIVASNLEPSTGGPWVRQSTLSYPTLQWWCNASAGMSLYQIDSPGTGWVACTGPASDDGWYLSTSNYGGPTTVISGGRPANPRTWTKIGVWATAGTANLGGSPAASCNVGNFLLYPPDGYTLGTDYPPIRIYDGRQDRLLANVPITDVGGVPQAVLSMLAADGGCFFSTFDSGTTSANWRGRVFQIDPTSGIITTLGLKFAAGEMPYALAWHMGRLWCGTNNGIGTVGKIYYFRPGIDTAWTLDHTSAVGAYDSLVSYRGYLYAGTERAAASRGVIEQRDSAGTWTTVETGAGGAAAVNNGYLSMRVFQGTLYAAYWNNDTPAITYIRKFDGTSWTTPYNTLLQPWFTMFEDNGFLYVLGGGKSLAGTILSTANGITWTDLTGQLPDTTHALLPMVGVEIL